MTYGFAKEGFEVIAGIDTDNTCEYAFEINNDAEFLNKNVETMTAQDLLSLYPEGTVRILVGCAPCQPFSQYTKPADRRKDDKWRLLYSFSRLIEGTLPEVVSMENVPHLLKFDGGKIFNVFVRRLESNGYNVWYSLVDCQDYGVPQTRKRLVLLASKLGPITLVERTHSPRRYRTVRQAIGKLPRINDGQACEDDPLHLASKLTSKNKLRILQSRPGGTWRDWDPELIVDCHRKKTGKTYPGVYGRMTWDKPGPTITTQCHGIGNGRFGHPSQGRAISLREAALLQTFPRNYEFVEPAASVVISNVARHIGNAVPVRLGTIIARSIKKHLESRHAANAQV